MFIYLLSCLLVNCHYATGYQIKRDRPIEGERRSKYYRCSLTVKELKIRHRPFVVCYWNLVERKMPSVLQSISAPRRGVDGSVGITKVWRRYCRLPLFAEVWRWGFLAARELHWTDHDPTSITSIRCGFWRWRDVSIIQKPRAEWLLGCSQ